MGWLRVVVGVFTMLHGIGHLTWFLAAWFPRENSVTDQPWLFSTGVPMSSPAGRVFGILALLLVVAFVAAGLGLLTRAAWASGLLLASATVSTIVVVPWWNASPGTTVINALLANVALVAVTAVPPLRGFAHLPSPRRRPTHPRGEPARAGSSRRSLTP